MILLLGHTGYVGSRFESALQARGRPFRAVSRAKTDYTNFRTFVELLDSAKPDAVINAAGYTGKPNVDACETRRAETLEGNALLAQTLMHGCSTRGIPLAHVSSGCIYSGGKLKSGEGWETHRNLLAPGVESVIREHPDRLAGFNEEDEPNFSFHHPPCSFYSGTKAMAETVLRQYEKCYLWRLRIPFEETDNPRNYISKLLRYPRLYRNYNSISHLGDFVDACLDLVETRAPFGIYNVTNPGWITTDRVVDRIRKILAPDREFLYWASDEEFYQNAASALRSNCVMDSSKLLETGVRMRPVEEALDDALNHWKPAKT